MKKKLMFFIVSIFCLFFASKECFAEECSHQWGEWIIDDEATCTYEGSRYRDCALCGESQWELYIDSDNHVWMSWETEQKATISKKGKKVRECEYCSVCEEKEIPKLKISKKEKKAVEVVKKYLKAQKQYNVKKMYSYYADPPKDFYFKNKKYMVKYCKRFNKKFFEYEIQRVKTNGNIINVYVGVKYPDGYRGMYKALCQSWDWVYDYCVDYNVSPSDETIADKIEVLLKKSINAYGVKVKNDTLVIPIRKTKNGWKISRGTWKMKNIANCGYEEAIRDANIYGEGEAFEKYMEKYMKKYGY